MFSFNIFLWSNTTQNAKTVVKISFFKVLTLTFATKSVYIREEFKNPWKSMLLYSLQVEYPLVLYP